MSTQRLRHSLPLFSYVSRLRKDLWRHTSLPVSSPRKASLGLEQSPLRSCRVETWGPVPATSWSLKESGVVINVLEGQVSFHLPGSPLFHLVEHCFQQHKDPGCRNISLGPPHAIEVMSSQWGILYTLRLTKGKLFDNGTQLILADVQKGTSLEQKLLPACDVFRFIHSTYALALFQVSAPGPQTGH